MPAGRQDCATGAARSINGQPRRNHDDRNGANAAASCGSGPKVSMPSSTKWTDNSQIELIASENFTSQAVLEATGSVLRISMPRLSRQALLRWVRVYRHRGNLARDRQNCSGRVRHVQPLPARRPTRPLMPRCFRPRHHHGLNLAHGGHLTHGHKLNFLGQDLPRVPYGWRRTTSVSTTTSSSAGRRAQAKMIIAGASASPRTLDFARFRKWHAVGAIFMDMATSRVGGAGCILTLPIPDIVTPHIRRCAARARHHTGQGEIRAASIKTVFPRAGDVMSM